ncbi:phage antirepressor KilAC domain-containing protein [Paenalkalicoccus suaedae]|uniref:Phage antirepressor KilAC domain-containing protein n=1 Tax=Paenalkalicoccus suaedae TaxID=2592382 RepID=A0A859FHK8_9BACI|nr:phage antirepressor KilAC domain-containing protein [Paenalkalicoccus suaedae]QKS71695.1 phage antirepressor KilAC domain-containing protein [Paenalkalicoccus suaedae]QKS71749.1 phage antirepressor KilAC domain-containing protein [Paenalkalicoccus suaedae]
MSDLITFQFSGIDFKAYTENGDIFFLLSEVCEILEVNHRVVKQRISDDVCSTYPIIDRLGREQYVTTINEDGLYDVILDSRKPIAKQFRKWITSEVIPSIRKHGGYLTPQTIEDALLNPDTLINLATQLKTERAEKEQLLKKQKKDEPFTNFGKAVSNTDAAINLGAYAKLIYDKHGVNIGRNKLIAWMRDKGYLIKSGREKNNAKQQYIEQGLFKLSPSLIQRTQGDYERMTTLITGKGQVKFLPILLKEFKQEVR